MMFLCRSSDSAGPNGILSGANQSQSIQSSVVAFGIQRKILVADDDGKFCSRLKKELQGQGFVVAVAHSVAGVFSALSSSKFTHALIDLRLDGVVSFQLLPALLKSNPDIRIILHSSYITLPLAVSAMRSGAYEVLAKSTDMPTIVNLLVAHTGEKPELPIRVMSADRVEREHIHRILESCEMNVSLAARQLRMHRRTLQRILSKRPPRS